MTYTPEQRAADAEIAVAMGWTQVHAYHATYCGTVPPSWKSESLQWKVRIIPDFHSEFDPDLECTREVPHFHDNPAARDALLAWLAADEKRWKAFEGELDQVLDTISLDPRDYRIRQRLMLATPAQVAEAALRVIKEGE